MKYRKMITTKISIILAVLLAVTALSTIGIGVVRAEDMFDRAKRTGETITFDMNRNTGITTWTDKHGNTAATDRHGNTISESSSASASRADSASAAKSENNVNCFMFCLGISTANSGSAADSNSRTNSPGNTATAMPVGPSTTVGKDLLFRSPQAAIVPFTQPRNDGVKELMVPTAGTQCIDNTGSHQDIGYNQGYVDGQRDFREQRGFDNSLHQQHTDEFKIGYKDGSQAGFDDAQLNVNKNPC
jgi:hypothetical protein